jgi:regulator of replication initiation timing
MEQVMEENSQLRTEVEGNLQQRNILSRELEEMRGQLQAMASENRKMDVEVQALRQSLQVYVTYLPTGQFGLLLS